jgi:molybdenum cofactor cytidylyltransferase
MTSHDAPTFRGVAGVLLAAGRSRRMGRPKQLLPLGPQGTLVEMAARRVRPFVEELVVVVGHVGGQVAAALSDIDVRLAVNGDVDRGMLSSVQTGLRAAPEATGYLICLGDQPGMPESAIRRVLACAAEGEAGIVLPTAQGKRGHPVYLAAAYRDEILRLDATTTGLNAVTRGHPQETREVPVDDDSILRDVDTPADYERERSRLEEV